MHKYLVKIILAISCVLPAIAFGNYTVAPIKLHIKEGSSMSSLTLNNNGDNEIHFQISIYPVHKDEKSNTTKFGEKETKDLISSPAMFKMKGQKEQIIRIAVKDPKAAATQKNYVISIKELPHKEKSSDINTIQFVTDFRVPVLVGNADESHESDTNKDAKHESDARNIIETKYMADAKHEDHKHEDHKHEDHKHEEHKHKAHKHEQHNHKVDESHETNDKNTK